MYTHVVMWKFNDDVIDSDKTKMVKLLLNLKKVISELIEIEVSLNSSNSVFSYDIILISKFASFKDYEIYAEDKNHKGVVNFINSITDQKAVIDF